MSESGWVYDKATHESVYRPSVGHALADLTGGLYGEEYDEKLEELNDLVEAVRREDAEIVREVLASQSVSPASDAARALLRALADKIDPHA